MIELRNAFLLDVALVQLLRAPGDELPGVESREVPSLTKLRGLLSCYGLDYETSGWNFTLGPTILRMRELISQIHFPDHSKWRELFCPILALFTEEINDFLARLEELYKLLGVDWDEEERNCYELKLIWLSLQDKIVKTLKVVTCDTFARHFKTELPEYCGLPVKTFWSYRFRMMLSAWTSQRRRRTHCWRINTIFQGWKRSLLPIRPEQILESLKSHQASLTSDPTFHGDMDRLEAIIERVVGIMGRAERFPDKIIKVSAKSTIESNLANKGQIGLAVKRMDEKEGLSFFIGRTEEVFLGYHGNHNPKPVKGPVLDIMEYKEVFREMSPDFKQEFEVTPSLVLEPMKCRIITKPGAGDYVPLNCLQQSLWASLQVNFPCFEAIGRPITVDDINDKFMSYGEVEQGEEWGFASADFSQATDRLKGEVSKMLAKHLFGPLAFKSPAIFDRIMKTLFETRVNWANTQMPRESPWMEVYQGLWNYQRRQPEAELRDEFHAYLMESAGLRRGQQTNGQLMGHVLSFILLCLANLVAYLYAYEVHHGLRRGTFSEGALSKIMINGDDLLFASSAAFYKTWRETVPLFGLIPSVGKNLFSKEIAQINSQLYILRKTPCTDPYSVMNGITHNCRFELVEFCNAGILCGRGKGRGTLIHEDLVNRVSSYLSENWFDSDGAATVLPTTFRMLKAIPTLWKQLESQTPQGVRQQVMDLAESNLVRPYRRSFPGLPWGLLLEEDHVERLVPEGKNIQTRDEISSDILGRRRSVFFEDLRETCSSRLFVEDMFSKLVLPSIFDKSSRTDTHGKYLPDQQDPWVIMKRLKRKLRSRTPAYWKKKWFSHVRREKEDVGPVLRDSRCAWTQDAEEKILLRTFYLEEGLLDPLPTRESWFEYSYEQDVDGDYIPMLVEINPDDGMPVVE
jgi:hypothetical protein